MNYQNIKKGDTVYAFKFKVNSCAFVRGKFTRDRGDQIEIDKVYIENPASVYWEVGSHINPGYKSLYKNFNTPIKKIVKFGFGKYMIQSLFNEGYHSFIRDENIEKF